jgi:hypothetical protein
MDEQSQAHSEICELTATEERTKNQVQLEQELRHGDDINQKDGER